MVQHSLAQVDTQGDESLGKFREWLTGYPFYCAVKTLNGLTIAYMEEITDLFLVP
jgi:hypothetical protein